MPEKKKKLDLIKTAREIIEEYVKNEKVLKLPLEGKKQGVFVTLKKDGELRGCIGIPEPVYDLNTALVEAAISSTQDPRFPPLAVSELGQIKIEITILTPPELIRAEKPEDYFEQIKIGRDGLIIRRGLYSGLLLPQVPTEQGWKDGKTFLEYTCQKACLPRDSWKDGKTQVYKFQGKVIKEE